MPAVFDVTLKVSHLDIPKGTVCRIVTSSESDHSTSTITRALRKQGFYDEDMKGVMNSALWDWKLVSADAAAVSAENNKYSLPRNRPGGVKASDSKKNKNERKKQRTESEGFIKRVVKSLFEGDDPSETNAAKAEALQAFLEFESNILSAQMEQAQKHKAEALAFEQIKVLVPGNVTSADQAIVDEYIALAQDALANMDALYYGARLKMKLDRERRNTLSANIKFAKSLNGTASKGFFSTLMSLFKK